MGSSSVTVAYPSDAKFNMDYYLSTHMPLVNKSWNQYGLKGWKIVKIDDPKSPYGVLALLEFENHAAFEKAAASPESPTVLGDIPNFSDKQPIMMAGNVVGTS